jgi:hypothetical protein
MAAASFKATHLPNGVAPQASVQLQLDQQHGVDTGEEAQLEQIRQSASANKTVAANEAAKLAQARHVTVRAVESPKPAADAPLDLSNSSFEASVARGSVASSHSISSGSSASGLSSGGASSSMPNLTGISSSSSGSGGSGGSSSASASVTSTPFSVGTTNFPAPRSTTAIGGKGARSKLAPKPAIAITKFVSGSPAQIASAGGGSGNVVRALSVNEAINKAQYTQDVKNMMRSYIAA